MQDIVQLATRLGKAIADAPQTKAMQQAREIMNADSETVQILSDYQQLVAKVAQLERENKPIEVDDKHNLKDFETKLLARKQFKAFTASQVEYVDLMRKVHEAMQKELAVVDADQPTGS